MQRLTMPDRKPKPRPTFVPYIFSRHQLRELLRTTRKCQDRRGFIDVQTMRTFILLIYGTGAFCGEILRLGFNDVDLDERTIRFREKGARSRVVPIGHSLAQVLAKYVTWRIRKKYVGSTFLITKYDQSIRVATAAKHFEKTSQGGRHFSARRCYTSAACIRSEMYVRSPQDFVLDQERGRSQPDATRTCCLHGADRTWFHGKISRPDARQISKRLG